jgi:hypothetical protein
LLKMTPAQVEADRFTAVEDLALRFGGVAVLKGAGSLIASKVDGCGGAGYDRQSGHGQRRDGRCVDWGHCRAWWRRDCRCSRRLKQEFIYTDWPGIWAAQAGGERGLLATDLLPWLRQAVNR